TRSMSDASAAVPGRIHLTQVVAGAIVFSLERSPDQYLEFYHSTPGAGTRVARVSMLPLRDYARLWFALVWSPEETGLTVGDAERHGSLQHEDGISSPRQLRVGTNGRVYVLGDVGAEVMGTSLVADGKSILGPTAIESWRMTLDAIRVLLEGTSTAG